MSHQLERTENNCLNCATIVAGRYCQNCGQENIEPKETFWHLVTHFFNDITHFDGKFFTTLKDILAMPGFLSKEYMIGKRARYLNPVRMYIFTSAIFFFILFSFVLTNDSLQTETTIHQKSLGQISKMDSATFAKFTSDVNKEDKEPAIPMSREEFKKYFDGVSNFSGLYFTSDHYKSKKEYDSLLASGAKKIIGLNGNSYIKKLK